MLRSRRISLTLFPLLLVLLLIPSAGRAVSDTVFAEHALRLLAEEPGETRREVAGIVCDNLRAMPTAQRDRLLVELPEAWRGATITDSTLTDLDDARADSVGSIVQKDGQLQYFPPEEFNVNPEPSNINQVTKKPERRIRLTVSARLPGSPDVVTEEKTILLRRPPVVLIHGVNSSADMWTKRSEFGHKLADALHEYDFELDLLEHGAPEAKVSKRGIQQELLFHGNGPVEHAAELLDKQIAARLQHERHGDPAFSIRRVDLVAHSYGGVIARWYLRAAQGNFPGEDSRRWYVHAANLPGSDGLYRFEDSWYNSPPYKFERPELAVRKLITIATPWRGTPIANYINQMRTKGDPLRLYKAPILFNPHFTLGTVVDKLLVRKGLAVKIITKAPSFEVNAVESKWLRALNGFTENGIIKPFLDDVAYAALAGDSSDFLDLSASKFWGSLGVRAFNIDLFELLEAGQAPSRFPYIVLDRRPGSAVDYSDGLIPVWSAMIPGGAVVESNHNSILLNDETINRVLCWLSNASLPAGRTLNSRWGEPIELAVPDGTNVLEKRWEFAPGAMAPLPQSDIYGLMPDGVARIKAEVYSDIRDVTVVPTSGGATLSWKTAIDMEHWVIVYEWRPVNFANWDFVEVREITGPAAAKEHTAKIEGLEPNTLYYFKIISDYVEASDGVLELQSNLTRFVPLR